MSQPQFQNGKDYGYYTIDTRFDVNGNIIGAGASAIEEIIESLLGKGKGSVLTESLKFMIKRGITSSVVTTSVEIGFNDQEVTVNGIIVDFVGENTTQALLSAIALALFGSSSIQPLPVIGISVASGFLWSNIKNTSLDLINGSLVDLKFINSSHNHTSGVFLQSESFEVLGVKGAITAYLANTSENIDGGYLTLADGRDGDQIGGEIYKIFNASAFQTVVDKLGISLTEFLNLGVDGKTNNDIFYSDFNKIVFTENTINPNQSSKIYIPVGSQIIAVDGVYSGSENGVNLLAGRTNEIIFGTTRITYPDALIIGSNEYGASMIIKSGRYEGNLEGNHILIGSNSADSIAFDKFATVIDGKDGIDTIDYSSLNFFNQEIELNLENGTATNGIAPNPFNHKLYNIENIIASQGDDSITANSQNNIIYGNQGNDNISGNEGDDSLYGDAGVDTISGGVGDDIIYGGENNDTLFGGSENFFFQR
jgi:Ca2+-binding RTX toxin-like protein